MLLLYRNCLEWETDLSISLISIPIFSVKGTVVSEHLFIKRTQKRVPCVFAESRLPCITFICNCSR